MNKKRIIKFVSQSKFPFGDAGASRLFYIARCFVSDDSDVSILGLGFKNNVKEGGISIYSARFFKKNSFVSKVFNKIINLFGFVKKTISFIKDADVAFIDTINLGINDIRYINKHNKNAVKVYLITENYTKEQFLFGGRFSRHYKKNQSINYSFCKEDGKIICISSYMEKLFKERGVDVLTVPFIADPYYFPKKSGSDISKQKPTEFVYCGIPGKKDDIVKMIKAFDYLTDSGMGNFHVSIAGLTKAKANKIIEQSKETIMDETMKKFTFYGPVNRTSIDELFSNADYSILFRDPNKKFAKAGFPTKVTESLFYGVPVVTNISSDLGTYLCNLNNSIIVQDYSSKSFYDALCIAVNLPADKKIVLKTNSLASANRLLSIQKWQEKIINFTYQKNDK